MFKRKPRSYSQIASDMVYPRGGWRRALSYLVYRLRRLPDPPQRIARGVAAGVFVSFSPLFGAHLVVAMALAAMIRGNVFAAVIGSLIGNPLTFPFIAMLSVGIGHWLLGITGGMAPAAILGAFSGAGAELWRNFMAVLFGGEAHWERLIHFWQYVFLPYLIGGLLPGLGAAAFSHVLTVPLVRTFHQRRSQRRERRISESAARRALAAAEANGGEGAEAGTGPAPLPALRADPGAPRPPDDYPVT